MEYAIGQVLQDGACRVQPCSPEQGNVLFQLSTHLVPTDRGTCLSFPPQMIQNDSCEERDWQRHLLVQVPEVKAEQGSVREVRYMELEYTDQLGSDSIVNN